MAVNVCTLSTSAADAAPNRPLTLALVAALPTSPSLSLSLRLRLATDTDTALPTLPATTLLSLHSLFSMPATS